MLNPHTYMQSKRGSHENRFAAKKHPSGALLECFGLSLGQLWRSFGPLGSPKGPKRRPGGAPMIPKASLELAIRGPSGSQSGPDHPRDLKKVPPGAQSHPKAAKSDVPHPRKKHRKIRESDAPAETEKVEGPVLRWTHTPKPCRIPGKTPGKIRDSDAPTRMEKWNSRFRDGRTHPGQNPLPKGDPAHPALRTETPSAAVWAKPTWIIGFQEENHRK